MWQDAEKYAENIIKLMEIDENSPKSNSQTGHLTNVLVPMEQLMEPRDFTRISRLVQQEKKLSSVFDYIRSMLQQQAPISIRVNIYHLMLLHLLLSRVKHQNTMTNVILKFK